VPLDRPVPILEPAVIRAIKAGATIEGETQTHNWGRIAHMADPFGHGICFIEFLGGGMTKSPTNSQTRDVPEVFGVRRGPALPNKKAV
jgi:hypothetical protein